MEPGTLRWKGNKVFFRRRRRHPIGDEDLSAYVDGQLGAAEQARVEAHVETCGECREALADLRALQRSIRELPQARAPRSFALREADVRPQDSPRPLGAFERAPALLGGLASVAFLVLGALVFVDLSGQSQQEGADFQAARSADDYAAPEMAEDAAAVPGAEADPPEKTLDGESTANADYAGDADDEPETGATFAPSDFMDGQRANGDGSSGDELDGGGFDTSLIYADGLLEVAEEVARLARYSSFWYFNYDLTATPECGPAANCVEPGLPGAFRLAPMPTGTPMPTLPPAPMPSIETEAHGDSRVALRAAEAATAALALLTTGSLALVWRRRRS